MAQSLGCGFQRIQCTPDLLPSDVTGIQFYDQATGRFEFRPGPIMANIVLVDEINRATPTQSALLEAMQEQQVTVDMETVTLPRPFMLMATQNPIELEGTFPLPEAQPDRFLLRLEVGYPSETEEGALLTRFQEESPLIRWRPSPILQSCCGCRPSAAVCMWTSRSATMLWDWWPATRGHAEVKLGASPGRRWGCTARLRPWPASAAARTSSPTT